MKVTETKLKLLPGLCLPVDVMHIFCASFINVLFDLKGPTVRFACGVFLQKIPAPAIFKSTQRPLQDKLIMFAWDLVNVRIPLCL